MPPEAMIAPASVRARHVEIQRPCAPRGTWLLSGPACRDSCRPAWSSSSSSSADPRARRPSISSRTSVATICRAARPRVSSTALAARRWRRRSARRPSRAMSGDTPRCSTARARTPTGGRACCSRRQLAGAPSQPGSLARRVTCNLVWLERRDRHRARRSNRLPERLPIGACAEPAVTIGALLAGALSAAGVNRSSRRAQRRRQRRGCAGVPRRRRGPCQP